MSAFILENDTIDLLVDSALHGVGSDAKLGAFHLGEWHYFNKYEDGNKLGNILKSANFDSVDYRYNEKNERDYYQHGCSEIAISYHLGTPVIPWGQVLKSLDCYEYQSCEHPEWNTSLAKAITEAIRRKVCHLIALEDEATWEWMGHHATTRYNELRLKS